MLSYRTEFTIVLEVPHDLLLSNNTSKEFDKMGEAKTDKIKIQKENIQESGDPAMLDTPDDEGWEPVANVMFQTEPGLVQPDPTPVETQVPPPPQFSAKAEITISSKTTKEIAVNPSKMLNSAPKQYVYGSDEDLIEDTKDSQIDHVVSPLVNKSPSHENLIEAEIRSQQIREETLRKESAVRSRDKVGGASSPSSHASDEGFVDRPEEMNPLISTTPPESQVFTHTLSDSNGEPIIYDAVNALPEFFGDKLRTVPSGTSETKIALEIRELREREAELRAMRELRQKELNALINPEDEDETEVVNSSSRDLIDDNLTSLTTTTDEGNYSECGDAISSEDKSSDGSNSRIMSPDLQSFGSHAESRQRRVVQVKPFEDLDNDDTPVYTRMKGESVIEREVRLATQREEAFRREKGLPIPSTTEGTKILSSVQSVLKSSSTSTILDTSKETNHSEEPPTVKRGSQHRFASNFIQQEIQEASIRERELQSSGQIKTLSEDTVDSKITRTFDGIKPSSRPRSASSSAATISTPRKEPLSPTISLSTPTHAPLMRKNSPVSPASPLTVPSFTPSPFQRPPAPTRLTRSLSTNNLSSPFSSNVSSTFRPKGLMQKFIASRGKITTPTFSSPNSQLASPPPVKNTATISANVIPTRPMKLQPKSLVIRQEIDAVVADEDPSQKSFKRTQVSAEEKIQEELREMKNREEELRRLRARTLARSQPNLFDGEDLGEDDVILHDSTSSNGGVDSSSLHQEMNGLRVALSNPNLLDIDTDNKNQPPAACPERGGLRKKSALIAHWEGRIQQTSDT